MKFIEVNEENREKGIQIISSIVDMAHKLHMIIVAEGVESREQVDMLRSMNCIYGQGFYFCKPMTVQEIHSMLDRMDADDYACTDLRRRNAEEGVFLRDLKTERDALAILRESALVLAGMDLNTGELQVAKADIPFPTIADNAPVHFSLFNNLVVAQKLIHPDDEAEYLRLTALSHLRELVSYTHLTLPTIA